MSPSNYLLEYPYYVLREKSQTIKKEIKISRIKLINQKINFSNKTFERKYTAIRSVFENGILKKLTKIIFIVIVLWHFTFGLSFQVKPKLESEVSQIKIERVIQTYSESEYKALYSDSFTSVPASLKNSTSTPDRSLNSNDKSKHGPGARGKAKANAASAAKAAKIKESKETNSSPTRSKLNFFAEALTSRVFPNKPGNGRISYNPATSLSPSDFGKAQGGARITQRSAAEREIEENGPIDQNNQPSSREREERIQQSIERSSQKPSQKEKQVSIRASNDKDYSLSEAQESHLTSRHGRDWNIDDPIETRIDKNGREQIITRNNEENRLKLRQSVRETLQDPESQAMGCKMRGTEAIAFHTNKYGGEFGNVVVIPTEGPFRHEILKAQPLSAIQWSRLQEFGIID